MSYSCSDFTDSILEALNIEVPEESWDSPSEQADLALAEIWRLQRIVKRALTELDDIHSQMEAHAEIDVFNRIGCLIAEAKGKFDPEETK